MDTIRNDSDNIIGNNIKRIRKQRSLGQTELVKILQLNEVEITRETLVKIERGIQHIKRSQLIGIKEALDTTYEELLEKK